VASNVLGFPNVAGPKMATEMEAVPRSVQARIVFYTGVVKLGLAESKRRWLEFAAFANAEPSPSPGDRLVRDVLAAVAQHLLGPQPHVGMFWRQIKNLRDKVYDEQDNGVKFVLISEFVTLLIALYMQLPRCCRRDVDSWVGDLADQEVFAQFCAMWYDLREQLEDVVGKMQDGMKC
jgi:hypothetical protein